MKFVFFLMRDLEPSIPSLTTVKNFSLLGLNVPKQVCVKKEEEKVIILIFSFSSSLKCFTPAGVPFHINSTIDILKLCMDNPHIASKVARYPVLQVFHAQRWLEDSRVFSANGRYSCRMCVRA